MELPFAVESPDSAVQGTTLHHSESSLVTASSQGSFVNSASLDSPLLPNTPQDVVLPRYDNRKQAGHSHQSPSIHQVPPAGTDRISNAQRDADDIEIIDFTYVNVSETDADDLGVVLEEGDFGFQPELPQRGDILNVLLSGMQGHDNETFLDQAEQASAAAAKAAEAKQEGDLMAALEYHTQAAKLYRDNALAIRERNGMFP